MEKTVCPCCGETTFTLPAKLPQQELDHYIACMLTGEEFTKTYKLFGDSIEITCRELNTDKADKVSRLLLKTPEKDPDTWNRYVTRLCMLVPIVKIKYSKGDLNEIKDITAVTEPLLAVSDKHVDDTEWLKAQYAALIDPAKVGALPRDVLDKVVRTHMTTVQTLVKSGFDQAFYEGIVQGS